MDHGPTNSRLFTQAVPGVHIAGWAADGPLTTDKYLQVRDVRRPWVRRSMLKNTFLAWLSWIFTIVMGVASNEVAIRNASGYMARQKVKKSKKKNYDSLQESVHTGYNVHADTVHIKS